MKLQLHAHRKTLIEKELGQDRWGQLRLNRRKKHCGPIMELFLKNLSACPVKIIDRTEDEFNFIVALALTSFFKKRQIFRQIVSRHA